jgi:hypothetical protein
MQRDIASSASVFSQKFEFASAHFSLSRLGSPSKAEKNGFFNAEAFFTIKLFLSPEFFLYLAI